VTRRRPPPWTGGLAELIVASGAVIAHPASRPDAYRRYVSPPLPDGTRLTFRYPASLGRPVEDGHSDLFTFLRVTLKPGGPSNGP
jgi:hypothetical protein